MRFGIVFSSTRLLFGIDYADKLLALFVGPVSFCLAWGPPETNPFSVPEEK